MVTHAAGGTRMGSVLATQLGAHPRAMYMAGGVLGAFGLVPGPSEASVLRARRRCSRRSAALAGEAQNDAHRAGGRGAHAEAPGRTDRPIR